MVFVHIGRHLIICSNNVMGILCIFLVFVYFILIFLFSLSDSGISMSASQVRLDEAIERIEVGRVRNGVFVYLLSMRSWKLSWGRLGFECYEL